MDRNEVKRLVNEVVDRLVPPASGSAVGTVPTRPAASSPVAPARTEPPASPGSNRARWVVWAPAEPPRHAAGRLRPDLPAADPPRDVSHVVAIGADHGAFRFKQQLARYLGEELRWTVLDCGTHSEEAVDYPDTARDVALAVAEGRASRGIVLDAMGIGSAMAANRIPGILCAVCHDEQTVRNAREHNDANVLSLGSRVVNPGHARTLVRLFLHTAHAGGRHARRVAKIRHLEELRSAPRGT